MKIVKQFLYILKCKAIRAYKKVFPPAIEGEDHYWFRK